MFNTPVKDNVSETVLEPGVAAFLGRQPFGLFVEGRFVAAGSGQTMETRNPSTGTLIAIVARGDRKDVREAVKSASSAFRSSGWAELDPKARAASLHRLADLIDQHTEAIAQIESLDVGKPVPQPRAFDVPHVAKTLRYYADLSAEFNYRQSLDASQTAS